MMNRRVIHHQSVMGEMTKQYGAERIFRGIRTDIALARSFEARQPICQFAPRSRGAMDYYLLAEELPRLWQWQV